MAVVRKTSSRKKISPKEKYLRNLKKTVVKHWKSILVAVVILLLLLGNFKQYSTNQKTLGEKQDINFRYQVALEKEYIYNEQIEEYKLQIAKRDSLINTEKIKIKDLSFRVGDTKNKVKNLSQKIKNSNPKVEEELPVYVSSCDSLSNVTPILVSQIDTLKIKNEELVNIIEEKTIFQDSIIKKKDVIINNSKKVFQSVIDSYNKVSDKLATVEVKLNKEKNRKKAWKKVAIGLGLGLTGVLILK